MVLLYVYTCASGDLCQMAAAHICLSHVQGFSVREGSGSGNVCVLAEGWDDGTGIFD